MVETGVSRLLAEVEEEEEEEDVDDDDPPLFVLLLLVLLFVLASDLTILVDSISESLAPEIAKSEVEILSGDTRPSRSPSSLSSSSAAPFSPFLALMLLFDAAPGEGLLRGLM